MEEQLVDYYTNPFRRVLVSTGYQLWQNGNGSDDVFAIDPDAMTKYGTQLDDNAKISGIDKLHWQIWTKAQFLEALNRIAGDWAPAGIGVQTIGFIPNAANAAANAKEYGWIGDYGGLVTGRIRGRMRHQTWQHYERVLVGYQYLSQLYTTELATNWGASVHMFFKKLDSYRPKMNGDAGFR